MTIVYALIARGKAVLAEFTATAGNFPTVTRVLLNKIPAEATRMSYVSQPSMSHHTTYHTHVCPAAECMHVSVTLEEATRMLCCHT